MIEVGQFIKQVGQSFPAIEVMQVSEALVACKSFPMKERHEIFSHIVWFDRTELEQAIADGGLAIQEKA